MHFPPFPPARPVLPLMGRDYDRQRVHLPLNSRAARLAADHLHKARHAAFPRTAPRGAYLTPAGAAWYRENLPALTAAAATIAAAQRAEARASMARAKTAAAAAIAAETSRLARIGPDGVAWEHALSNLGSHHAKLTKKFMWFPREIESLATCRRREKPTHRARLAELLAAASTLPGTLTTATAEILAALASQPHPECCAKFQETHLIYWHGDLTTAAAAGDIDWWATIRARLPDAAARLESALAETLTKYSQPA